MTRNQRLYIVAAVFGLVVSAGAGIAADRNLPLQCRTRIYGIDNKTLLTRNEWHDCSADEFTKIGDLTNLFETHQMVDAREAGKDREGAINKTALGALITLFIVIGLRAVVWIVEAK